VVVVVVVLVMLVVRRSRRAGHQKGSLGYRGDGDLFVDRHVGSNIRYGCHLLLMLASGWPLGVRIFSQREGPVREWLVDQGHDS
jgi:hypothetical protein